MANLSQQWNICASIPVFSLKSVTSIVRRAETTGVNWIEYRLDYYPNLTSISIRELSSFLALTPLSTIFCISTPESSINIINEKQVRVKCLMNCIQAHPTLIDLDLSLPFNDIIDLSHLAGRENVGVVYSIHNFLHTPTISDIIGQMEEIEHKILPLITNLPRVILKLVYYARKIADNEVVFPVYQSIKKKQYELILFCMGSLGSLSRIYSLQAGAPFAYVAIDVPTAPGQLSIEEFRKKLKL